VKLRNNVLAPNLWRSLAAVLISLGLVLPISKCTTSEPPTYRYAFDNTWQEFEACKTQPAATASWRCYSGAAVATVCVLVTFLWPVVALGVARREERPTTRAIRLVLEPLLLAGMTCLLIGGIWLNDPASGFFVAISGVPLYYFGWTLEIFGLTAGQASPSPLSSARRGGQ
jgi:hypothetical protein